jgi:putative oxidoreductase
MKRVLINPWLQTGLRLIAAAVFIDAGTMKIRDPEAFAKTVMAFHLLAPPFVSAMARGLPWLEVICGALLASGWGKRPIAFSLLVLDTAFLVVLSQAAMRGLNVDCGCFGAEQTGSTIWMALGRDLLLMGALCAVYWNSLRSDAEFNSEGGKVLMLESMHTKA